MIDAVLAAMLLAEASRELTGCGYAQATLRVVRWVALPVTLRDGRGPFC